MAIALDTAAADAGLTILPLVVLADPAAMGINVGPRVKRRAAMREKESIIVKLARFYLSTSLFSSPALNPNDATDTSSLFSGTAPGAVMLGVVQ